MTTVAKYPPEEHDDKVSARDDATKYPQVGQHALSSKSSTRGLDKSNIGNKAFARAAAIAKHPSKKSGGDMASATNDPNDCSNARLRGEP